MRGMSTPKTPATDAPPPGDAPESQRNPKPRRPKEIGGPKGPEPTRFGDWERDGRCVDF